MKKNLDITTPCYGEQILPLRYLAFRYIEVPLFIFDL